MIIQNRCTHINTHTHADTYTHTYTHTHYRTSQIIKQPKKLKSNMYILANKIHVHSINGQKRVYYEDELLC